MGKHLKVLVIGLGSIGRRHLDCLQKIPNVDVAAFRTSRGTLKEPSGIQEFFSLKEALEFDPDGVIVANPTSLHISSALPFLRAGKKVLIEKPISHDIEDAEILNEYKDNLRVAYCMRFLPLASFFKSKFNEEPPFKISFKRSYYLPKWHPYADYRKEYTARKELGGGVIRTLSHEIDLGCYWLGSPVSTTGVTDKISFLELDTDDFAFFTLKADNGCRINFELDFFSPENINYGEAFTSKGKYFWDLNGFKFTPYEKNVYPNDFEHDLNAYTQMYQLQMVDFIEFLKTGKSVNATFEESIEVLRIIKTIDEK